MLSLFSCAVIGQKGIKITYIIGQPGKDDLTNLSTGINIDDIILLAKHVAR